MTSFSASAIPVDLVFLRDAKTLYGEKGLATATENAAGTDLRACLVDETEIVVPAGERRSVPSGIRIAPRVPGIAAFVYSRSGLGAVKGLTVAQGVGLIDPDYRGEIMVFLLNTGAGAYTVRKGDRIAQMVFQPFVLPAFTLVPSLDGTARGGGGFGHTGSV
ncbi:MAG: dUTP diphosphatase [Desulfovibrio sp.]|jgi:dUTP pyrophosphatase|nr:dUTP diphosphatase [Desulfovibrio sp.]